MLQEDPGDIHMFTPPLLPDQIALLTQAGRDCDDFGAALNRFLLRYGSTFMVYTDAVAIGRGGIVNKVRSRSADGRWLDFWSAG